MLDRAPPPPHLVLERRADGGRLAYPRLALRPAVRFFVKQHMFRSLSALTRGYQRRAALCAGEGAAADEAELLRQFDLELGLLERYRQSLGKKPPYKTLAVSLFLAAILGSFLLVGTLPFPRKAETLPFLRAVSSHVMPPDIPELWKAAANASDRSAADRARGADPSLDNLDVGLTAEQTSEAKGEDQSPDSEDLEVMALAMAAVLICLYIMLSLLPIGAFRVKRLAFNLHPDVVTRRPDGAKREHDVQATGLFDYERQLFDELRATPPREVPFDLVRYVVMLLPVLLLALMLVGVGIWELGVGQPSALGGFDTAYLGAVAFVLFPCLVPLARALRWWQVWRRRSSAGASLAPTLEPPAQRDGPKHTTLALWALVGLAFIVVGVGSEESQADPADWGMLSLALLAVGVVVIWLGRLAARREQAAELGRWKWKVVGYVLVVVGLTGLIGLHHPLIGLGSVVAAVGALVVVESRPVPSKWTRTLPRALVVPAAPVVALSTLGLAMWAWLEPIGPFPTAKEAAVLSHLPPPLQEDRSERCRRLSELLFRESIEVECVVTRHVSVTLHRFPTSRQSEAAFKRYTGPKRLPERACDPADEALFSGTAAIAVGGRAVGRVACYLDDDGYPWVEWTRSDQRIYAYASVGQASPDRELLRQETVFAWRLFNPE